MWAAITESIKWLFRTRPDHLRVSYESITAMYEKLVATTDQRIEKQNKRLDELSELTEKALKAEAICENNFNICQQKVAALEARINAMK